MPFIRISRPWILGSLAIYAPTLSLARQVRDLVTANQQHDAFGTVTLATGEAIDWIDMSYQAMLRSHARGAGKDLPSPGPTQDISPVF